MNHMKTIAGCSLAALLVSASASAAFADEIAIVSKVVGKNVTWQHGEDSAAPRIQTLLGAGDQIAAGKGSYVEIQYLADRCTIRVNSGGSMVIGDGSPCAAAAEKTAEAPKAAEATVASAVEVLDVTGPVARVNKGEGMASTSVGDKLKAGDEVFAGKDSSVSLYFASAQCSYTIPSSTVYKIADKAPCAAQAANVVPTADVPSEVAVPPVAPFLTPGVLLGGAAIIGGGALVVVLTNDDPNNDNSPTTPN